MNVFLKNLLPQDKIFGFSILLSVFVHMLLLLDFSFYVPQINNPKLVYIPSKKKIKPMPSYIDEIMAFNDKKELPDSVPKDVKIGMGKTRLPESLPPENKINKLRPKERSISGKFHRQVKDITEEAFKQMINIENIPPDPSIRAYYLNYYQSIRMRIRQIAYKKYRQNMPQGDVFLSFSLERSGKLISAFVDRGRSSADYELCELALDSLREASPFDPFPKELIQEELSFNVIVSFRRK